MAGDDRATVSDPLKALAAAQQNMLAAEAKRDRAQRQLEEARAELKAAYAARVAALKVVTRDGDPASMVAAAAALKISLARVYQLARGYPKSKPLVPRKSLPQHGEG